MLTYYTAKDLLCIVKSLNRTLYEKIKNQSTDTQRYLGNLFLNSQIGGEDNDLKNIQNVNIEIRNIITNMTDDVRSIRKQLDFTKEENKLLKKQLKEINNHTEALDNIKQCDVNEINNYVDRFLETKKLLRRFTNKVEELSEKNLNISIPKNNINEYQELYGNVENVEISKDNVNCENFERIRNSLQSFNDANLFQRILDDFEAISGTVRVFVRILNRSSFDKTKQFSGTQTFNQSITLDGKNKVKIHDKKIVESCTQDSCLSLPSVVANGKMVNRSQYPCSQDNENLINFKHRYGPFFSVFENKSNHEVFNGHENNPGIQTIVKQINNGVNTVVFSYGLSGSGKSHSILGSPEDDGMVQLLLKNIENNVKNIDMNIYELYGRIDTNLHIKKNIIDYGNTNITNINDIINKIEKITNIRRKEKRIKFTTNNPDSSRGHLFINLKFTLNNGKQSSTTFIDSAGVENPFVIARTFLHVDEFAVKNLTKDVVKSLLTNISDSQLIIKSTFWNPMLLKSFLSKYPWASRIKNFYDTRRPGKIVTRFVDKTIKDSVNKIMKHLFLFSLHTEIIKSDEKFKQLFGSLNYDKVNINLVIDYIWDMFTEGIFINETLNHLQIYMQTRVGRKITFNQSRGLYNYQIITANDFKRGDDKKQYKPSKLLSDPTSEIKTKKIFNPSELKNRTENIDMINFLKYLTFSNSPKPPKYVLLMNIRTDLDSVICSGAKQTLDFANSVKST